MIRLHSNILSVFTSLVVFSVMQASSQSLVPNVEIITADNGLSQVSISCILQDTKGFLWIGTQDGLNLYNGKSFRVFQQDPTDTSSIIHNFIKALAEDHNGNIWIGTINGICMYDRRKEIFINVFHAMKSDPFSGDKNIYALFVDHTGLLWIKTLDYLYSYNKVSGKLDRFRHFKSALNVNPDQQILPLMEDKRGIIFVGTKEGLNLLNPNNREIKRFIHDPNDFRTISNDIIKAILEDSDGKLWIGTNNGLNEFDPNTETFRNVFISGPKSGNSNSINAIAEGEDGILWIGTADAYYKYQKSSARLERFDRIYYNNNIYPVEAISSMCMDRSAILWMGVQQGLIKYDTKPRKFALYRKNGEGLPDFSSNDIGSIYQDKTGLIWLGTWGRGLNIYNRNTQKVIHYAAHSKDPRHRISDDFVHIIFPDKQGNIYIGTLEGLDVFDKNTLTFSPFCRNTNAVSCNFMHNKRKYSVIEDHEGNLWIGTSLGLHKYDAKYKMFRNIYFLENESMKHDLNIVYALHEDHSGLLWIGTDNGLIKYNQEKQEFQVYKHQEKPNSNTISSNSVYFISEDSKGTLWLGTASGLNKYEKEADNFKVYTVKDGLPNNTIYSIVEDGHGMLWMATNKGIAKFNPGKETFVSFDLSDGLQNYEFNYGAYFKSPSGEIFFGGINGVNSFFPDSIKINRHIPSVAITSFELITPKGQKRIPLYDLEYINIPFKNRSFTIEFSTLDFTNPARNHYAYKLVRKGEDGDWIEAGNRNFASYNDVPPGDYIFMVKGSNSDQVWNDQETILEIIVSNTFLLTRTAYTLYALMVILLVVLIIRWRTSKLRIDNKELKEKQQAAIKIAKQKEELTIKNKNITDSLNYAKRIQQALMPSVKSFKKILPESFILHKPKDIVSGDFYWLNENANRIYVAAVDCTGHGVPGAFMSIIGFELFRKIAYLPERYSPDQILNLLKDDFAIIFKDVEGISLKDGMDIALCIIEKRNGHIQFSGAFNPLYVIRENSIIELKGNRFSLGLDNNYDGHQGFTSQLLQLRKDDMIYLFSDGYADQFGGPEGKKFKYRRFRHILLNIHKLSMEEQKNILEQTIENWRGSTEQIDDILVIGFRPSLGN